MNLPYRSFNAQMQTIFGERVHKIPLDAGMHCPNKTGEISDKGCLFCDSYGAGYIAHHGMKLADQIAEFKMHRKEKKFLAYFQANSNTYASVEKLSSLFDACLSHDDICGLIVATRPDCLPERILSLLELYAQKTFLVVELGLQTIHESSLLWLNRNHTYAQFLDAFLELRRRQIRVVVHLIVGIPAEQVEDNRQTIQKMNDLFPWAVKFHALHVLKGTALNEMYQRGELRLMQREEYINIVMELLECLHPEIGVHRLSADRDVRLFVAPDWLQHKTSVVNEIHQRMICEKRWQGKKLGFPMDACRQ